MWKSWDLVQCKICPYLWRQKKLAKYSEKCRIERGGSGRMEAESVTCNLWNALLSFQCSAVLVSALCCSVICCNSVVNSVPSAVNGACPDDNRRAWNIRDQHHPTRYSKPPYYCDCHNHHLMVMIMPSPSWSSPRSWQQQWMSGWQVKLNRGGDSINASQITHCPLFFSDVEVFLAHTSVSWFVSHSHFQISTVSLSLDRHSASVDHGAWYIFWKLWPRPFHPFHLPTYLPKVFWVTHLLFCSRVCFWVSSFYSWKIMLFADTCDVSYYPHNLRILLIPHNQEEENALTSGYWEGMSGVNNPWNRPSLVNISPPNPPKHWQIIDKSMTSLAQSSSVFSSITWY